MACAASHSFADSDVAFRRVVRNLFDCRGLHQRIRYYRLVALHGSRLGISSYVCLCVFGALSHSVWGDANDARARLLARGRCMRGIIDSRTNTRHVPRHPCRNLGIGSTATHGRTSSICEKRNVTMGCNRESRMTNNQQPIERLLVLAVLMNEIVAAAAHRQTRGRNRSRSSAFEPCRTSPGALLA